MRNFIASLLLLLSSVTSAEECIYSLDLNKSSYLQGEDISVRLTQCNPADDDFVAIYDADAQDVDGDAKYHLWMRTCGTQYCTNLVEKAMLLFGKKNNRHTWPLPNGTYKAHLVKRDAKDVFKSFRISEIFTVHEANTEQTGEAAVLDNK